jgi:hypothetical protein
MASEASTGVWTSVFFVDPLNTQLTGNFPRDTRRYDRTIILGMRSSF